MPRTVAIVLSLEGAAPPEVLTRWLGSRGIAELGVTSSAEMMATALRGRPRCASVDARVDAARALEACKALKADSYTGIVPTVVFCVGGAEALNAAFDAGADEVIDDGMPPEIVQKRLDAMLARSDRDTTVHPSTRLPGTFEIEAEIARRLAGGDRFAVCYADLDHFKEFNDRYSYFDGDRVIRILARILHDVVKGICGSAGFVGHIGGDDFIFIIPLEVVNESCSQVVEIFDALVPFQYSEQDRRAGYYFGKDRRGQLHRVPLMTVSIGVVTNERRTFSHAAQVSELATEMKSYAKTLPGSVYTIDRRHDATAGEDPSSSQMKATGVGELP